MTEHTIAELVRRLDEIAKVGEVLDRRHAPEESQ